MNPCRHNVITSFRHNERRPFNNRRPKFVITSFRHFVISAVVILAAALSACQYKDLCYDHNHGSEANLSLQLNLKLELDVNLEVSEEAHTPKSAKNGSSGARSTGRTIRGDGSNRATTVGGTV